VNKEKRNEYPIDHNSLTKNTREKIEKKKTEEKKKKRLRTQRRRSGTETRKITSPFC